MPKIKIGEIMMYDEYLNNDFFIEWATEFAGFDSTEETIIFFTNEENQLKIAIKLFDRLFN